MSMSNYLEDEIIDHIFRNTAIFATGDTYYVRLWTTLPAEDGTGGTEVTGGSYAAQSFNTVTNPWTASSGGDGETDNPVAITFPTATAAWGTVAGITIEDAASAGNMLFVAPLLEDAAVPFAATVDATDEWFHAISHGLSADDPVFVFPIAGGAALPTGVSENTLYYLHTVATDTFELATGTGGSGPLAITTDGSCLVCKAAVKVVGDGDTFSFPIGKLKVRFH